MYSRTRTPFGTQLVQHVQSNPINNEFTKRIEMNKMKEKNEKLRENPWAWLQWVIQQVSDHKPALDFDGITITIIIIS